MTLFKQSTTLFKQSMILFRTTWVGRLASACVKAKIASLIAKPKTLQVNLQNLR